MNTFKKKAVSLLLTVVIIISCVSSSSGVSGGVFTVGSTGIVGSGNCGRFSNGTFSSDVKWTLYADGLLSIGGKGEMADFSWNTDSCDVPYAGCVYDGDYNLVEKQIQSVVIESGVTRIGKDSFKYCKNLTTVSIADSVKSIGENAFYDCDSLSSVSLPCGISELGRGVFDGCDSLSAVRVSEDNASFSDVGGVLLNKSGSELIFCPAALNQTEYSVPETVTAIAPYAFSGCVKLTRIMLPESVTDIGDYAFYNCVGLEKMTFPKGVSSVGAGVFSGCKSLEAVTLPHGVEKIGRSAFSGCISLQALSLPDSVNRIEAYAFDRCKSLEAFAVPDGVTEIPDAAFNNCSILKRIIMPQSVRKIGSYAFHGCIALKDVTLPENVTDIGAYAFKDCMSLEQLFVPDSVCFIGHGAFAGCTGLSDVRLSEGLKAIGNFVFSGCENLTEVTLPDRIESVGWRAFENCKKLTEMILPPQVKTVGWYAFSGCSDLGGVILPASVTVIEPYTFASCSSLGFVYFTGSDTQWNSISVAQGNEALEKAVVECNYTDTHIHRMQFEKNVLPTCITDGFTRYICSVCGKNYDCEAVAASGHEFISYEPNKDATCTADGTKTAKCVRCDARDTVTDTDSKLGHRFLDYVSNKDATCTADGTKTAKCVRCDARDTVTDTDSKLGHDFSYYVSNKDATCTADGTKTAECTRCHVRNTVKDNGSKLSHRLKNTLTKATGTKDGKLVGVCTGCGKTVKTKVIPKASFMSLSTSFYTYDGKVRTPSVTVKDSKGKKLENGTDYTVKYPSGRKKTGRYAVRITLKGNYEGKTYLYFCILPSKTAKITSSSTDTTVKVSWKAVTGADGYKVTLYSQNNQKIRSAYTDGTEHTFIKLSAGTTYKIRVTAYKKINGKRQESKVYSSVSVFTKPGTPAVKVKVGSKKAVLSWSRQTGASGYIVRMATAKNGKYTKLAVLKGNSKVSFTKTGLTKGKTYYFKVAAYSTVGKKTVYGSYSSVKSVTIK